MNFSLLLDAAPRAGSYRHIAARLLPRGPRGSGWYAEPRPQRVCHHSSRASLLTSARFACCWAAPSTKEGKNVTFCIQQVQGAGDCLFHSIAISMAFEDEECHLDMYDPSLKERVSKLRALAVKTLTENPNRSLHLEGNQAIVTSELVEAAAEQYGVTAEAYCNSMSRDGVWGGGPEILALVNALERPIHVFEPVAACNGTQFQLQLCGAFGSPQFDSSSPVCIVAADDRFPDCKPTEVKRHGEGGNHFLALLPACGLPRPPDESESN